MATQLTKDQRYTAYCIMREEAQHPCRWLNFRSNEDGFCLMLACLGIDTYTYNKEFEMEELFPELFNKKPPLSKWEGAMWFKRGEWSERIKILDACIAETHPDNS